MEPFVYSIVSSQPAAYLHQTAQRCSSAHGRTLEDNVGIRLVLCEQAGRRDGAAPEAEASKAGCGGNCPGHLRRFLDSLLLALNLLQPEKLLTVLCALFVGCGRAVSKARARDARTSHTQNIPLRPART
jgi:hypothetical protein